MKILRSFLKIVIKNDKISFSESNDDVRIAKEMNDFRCLGAGVKIPFDSKMEKVFCALIERATQNDSLWKCLACSC